jgi:TPR repeat protein
VEKYGEIMTRLQELVEAAEEGNQSAMHLLAVAYADGDDSGDLDEIVEKDINKAIYWLERAAAEGYEMAMLTLGDWYSSAHYGIFDLEKAEAWFRLAQEKGSPYAERFLKKIESMKEEKND